MNPLRLAVFLFIDLVLFIITYFTGMYRSLFFKSVFYNISTLPIFTSLRSLLILIIMSVPILLVMILINKKWLKQHLGMALAAHFVLVLIIWGTLEIII